MALRVFKLAWSCSCKTRPFFSLSRNASSSPGGFSVKQAKATANFGLISPVNQTNAKEHVSSFTSLHSSFPLESPLFNPILTRIPMGIPVNYKINPITYDDKSIKQPLEDPKTSIVIDEAPDVVRNRIEKHAARLIVIRRIKMNRHKLKKLRKRMKHVFAKRKLRRAIRKERAFLDARLAQIREAERFDAEKHVTMLIAKAKEKEIPRRYKGGKRMPLWWIKEQIALGKIKF